MTAEEMLFARQPVFKPGGELFGYELLWQSSRDDPIPLVSRETWDALTDHHPGFIRLTRSDIGTQRQLVQWGAHQIIPIFNTPWSEYRDCWAYLQDNGIQLAGQWRKGQDIDDSLLNSLTYLRIDEADTEAPECTPLLAAWRAQSSGKKLMICKVDSAGQRQRALLLGADLISGYCLMQAPSSEEKPLTASQVSLLQLLSILQNPLASRTELENILKKDPGLSFQILRIANSAIYQFPHRIQSLSQAIDLLGTQLIRRFATMLALSREDRGSPEVLVTGLMRANMCESLGKCSDIAPPEKLFLVGLFSVLDILLQRPVANIFAELPLSPDVAEAIQFHRGLPGTTLDCVKSWETGQWDALDWTFLESHQLSEDALSRAYLEAVRWANDCRHQLLTA